MVFLFRMLTGSLILSPPYFKDTFTTFYFTQCFCPSMGYGQWMPRRAEIKTTTTATATATTHLSLQRRLHLSFSLRGFTLMRVMASAPIHYGDGRSILPTSFPRWTRMFATRKLHDMCMDCSDRRDCDT